MADANDIALLREYADRNSEPAFSEIVHRHINLVYSVALRFTGNGEDAQDVTQAVFVILAKKAAGISPKTVLTGWLYETTRFTAMNFLTSKTRRQAREQEAYMQSILDSNTESTWRQLAPMLEEAMTRLSEKERTLVALRFFENRSVAETAAALGIQEWAARKRVERAIEKLQQFFAKRGVSSTAATIAGAISANSVQAAPAVLAKTATALALAKGATASTSSLTLVKGALKIMAWTRAETAITVGAVVFLAAGTTIVGVKKYEASNVALDSWRIPRFAPNTVANAAPQVRILTTKFTDPVYGEFWASSDKWAGVNVTVSDLARTAYNWSPGRIYSPGGEPSERYDFATTLSHANHEALQKEIKKTLGLVGRGEIINTNVFVLKVQTPGAPGLKPHTAGLSSGFYDIHGHIISKGFPLSITPPVQSFGLARYLEAIVQIPVIDETGIRPG